MRVFRHMDRQRPEKFRAFLYKVARHVVYDRLRKIRQWRVVLETGGLPIWSFASDVGPRLVSGDPAWRSALGQAVLRLPPRQREAVILCVVEGLTLREAADILGFAPATVMLDVRGALRYLKSRLEGSGDRRPQRSAKELS